MRTMANLLLYPAIIEKTDAGFAVFFPDVACGGAGDTMEEAVLDAEEGLSAHLFAMREAGVEAPKPTPLNAVKVDKDIEEVGRLLVRYQPPAHSVRLNITMEETLLEKVDKRAVELGTTRSGLLAEAAREFVTYTSRVQRKDQKPDWFKRGRGGVYNPAAVPASFVLRDGKGGVAETSLPKPGRRPVRALKRPRQNRPK